MDSDVAAEPRDSVGTNDVCTIILGYLSMTDVYLARQVCRRWWWEVYNLMMDDSPSATLRCNSLAERSELDTLRSQHPDAGRGVPWLLGAMQAAFREVSDLYEADFVFPPEAFAHSRQHSRGLSTTAWFLHCGATIYAGRSLPTNVLPAVLQAAHISTYSDPWSRFQRFKRGLNFMLYSHVMSNTLLSRLSEVVPTARSPKTSATDLKKGLPLLSLHQMEIARKFQSADFSKRFEFFCFFSNTRGLVMKMAGVPVMLTFLLSIETIRREALVFPSTVTEVSLKSKEDNPHPLDHPGDNDGGRICSRSASRDDMAQQPSDEVVDFELEPWC